MRYGPLLFLGLLGGLALSWLGMIATPQLQIGGAQPTNVPPANIIYPTPSSGMAAMGRDVYRANGCAYCHTQVVRQDGTQLDVVLNSPGTNEASVVEALLLLRKDLSPPGVQTLLQSLPATVLTVDLKTAADDAEKALSAAGAEASVRVVPTGPEIKRGWGTRLSVANDYLYHTPLMLGSARLGPDLANVGLRQPDVAWHLIHLYDPKLKVEGSTMPRYPFLFEQRARSARPSPNALPIPGPDEIVPTREANALATYLASLRSDVPLFEAPAPQLKMAIAGASTNQPAGAATNAPAAGPSTDSTATNQAGQQ